MKNEKCDNCGKNTVNFYYRTNINGKVTERHLCQECAEKLGAEQEFARETAGMLDSFWGETESFFPGTRRMFSPFEGFGFAIPALIMPQIRFIAGGDEAEKAPGKEKAAADPEMEKRRQVNMLRTQMSEAADAEDFEKAAELRDKIRALENEKKAS